MTDIIKLNENDNVLNLINNNNINELSKMLNDGIDANTSIWSEFNEPDFGKLKLKLPLLHIASSSGNDIIANKLIEFGAKIDGIDKYGTTALHWAATSGQINIIRLLLNLNVNIIDQRDCLGMTALHNAAYSGKTKTIKYLFKMGADLSIISKNKETALDLAKSRNNKNCICVLSKMQQRKLKKKKRLQNKTISFDNFDNQRLKYEMKHGRTSTTFIDQNAIDQSMDNKHFSFTKMVKETDITRLILQESQSWESSQCSTLSDEGNQRENKTKKENEKELKLKSVKSRKEIKSLQSDATNLRSLQREHQKMHNMKKKSLKKELRETRNKVIDLKKKKKLNRSKLTKQSEKLKKLKKEKEIKNKTIIISKYNMNTNELKKQLFYKLKVLKKINAENKRLQQKRDEIKHNIYIKVQKQSKATITTTTTLKEKQLNFNYWIQDIVSLPVYKKQFEKYEYNRLDVIKHLNGTELKQIGIQNLKHRQKLLTQIRKLREAPNQKQIGV